MIKIKIYQNVITYVISSTMMTHGIVTSLVTIRVDLNNTHTLIANIWSKWTNLFLLHKVFQEFSICFIKKKFYEVMATKFGNFGYQFQ